VIVNMIDPRIESLHDDVLFSYAFMPVKTECF